MKPEKVNCFCISVTHLWQRLDRPPNCISPTV